MYMLYNATQSHNAYIHTRMSLTHFICFSTGSQESPITFTFLFLKSSVWAASELSSVVQTGVKSAGCENRTPHLNKNNMGNSNNYYEV